ncbi:MAG: aminotransferase [Planctomycetaceae bacterium]|nr:aminotransferase [Planctomycetaceae bacterium]
MDAASTATWRREWVIREDTTYLNHGSFAPTPHSVRESQLAWQRELTAQPMDFYLRRYEQAWLEARQQLAGFLGAAAENLVFIENATAAMNVVAATVRLTPDDEVVLTDHEYGAVCRIWQRACRQAGAAEPVTAQLPARIESAEQLVDALFTAVTPRTRLLVVSHITSATAVTFPVERICQQAQRRGIAVCVDGPHAPGQVPVSVDALGCDFYTASLHKWFSAPLGSGFLYVASAWHDRVVTPLLSWGRLEPQTPQRWWEEFVWTGTRDPSAYLATTAALELLQRVGLDTFRTETHELARYARGRLVELTGLQPAIPDSPDWYTAMAHAPLPPGDADALQRALWDRHRIEVPVIEHNGQRAIRVSCHLYNDRQQVDYLIDCLQARLADES